MKNGGINFSWQNPHNGKSGHIKRDSGPRLQFIMTQSTPTSNDIPGPTARLDDKSLGVESLEYVSDDLSNGLEGGEIIFGFLIALDEFFGIVSHFLETGFCFTMFADLGSVLFQDLVAFAGGCWCCSWCCS